MSLPLVYNTALAAGVDPRELWAVWQQESKGSTDPAMRGKTPTKYGRAIGPWQIMPFHNPPADFPGQTKWAAEYWASGGDTFKERVKNYYGSGTPPPGHPTWQQYAAKIRSRMQNAPSVQSVLNQTPSNPPTEPQSMIPMPQAPAPVQMPQAQNPFNDPMFFLMLASGIDPSSQNPFAGVGPNIAAYQKMKFDQELDEAKLSSADKWRRYKIEQEQAENARQRQALSMIAASTSDPAVAAAIQAGVLPPTAIADVLGVGGGADVSYGTTPHYERDADGTVYVVRYASDGTKIREPTQGAPFALESKTPGFQQRVSEAKAFGADIGKDRAAAVIDLPTMESSASRSLQTIDALLADAEGMRRAVGVNSLLPSIPGGKAADYETRLNQLYGQNFLQAYQDLKGGGAISEAEGKKAEQAIAAISTSQSVEAHRAALEELREVVVSGLERARKKAGISQPPVSTENRSVDLGDGWSVTVEQ